MMRTLLLLYIHRHAKISLVRILWILCMIHAGGDYPFKVVMNGYSGHLSVVPLPSVCKETPYDKLPQLVLVSITWLLSLFCK
jgi:hypothetical protein